MSYDSYLDVTSFASSPLIVRENPQKALKQANNKLQKQSVKELWIFLACIIAFFTCINVLRIVSSWIWKPVHPNKSSINEKVDPEATAHITTGNLSIRRLPSAGISAFRIVAFRWSIPVGLYCRSSVSELTVIFGYIAANFLWCFLNTWNLNPVFFQDRAAHLASCQLPLIVALAGKNNVISWMTGISHEKLNVLHRASGRTNLILLWVHSLTRIVEGLPAKHNFTHDWMQNGLISVIAFSLATVLSIRPIRNMTFEFFLISHIVLILIFIVCGYYHVKGAGGGKYVDYIWPALLVWGFDRFLRIVRVLYNNRIWSRKNPEHSLATIELLSPDTVRLTLRRKFSWTPGQHAYVALPTVSTLPTEAHPFTIASIPEQIEGTKDKDVVFIIRGLSGFTQRLRNHADRNGVGSVRAYIDGPYGCPPDLRPFSTCILFAGGSGISYTLPLLLYLIKENKQGGNSAVRRIVFIWSVRDGAHLKWLSKMVASAMTSTTSTLVIEPLIYVTGSNYPVSELRKDGEAPLELPSSSSSEKDLSISESEVPDIPSMKLHQGRPDIKKILNEEISASSGPVSVDVAGPAGLTESIRRALSSDVASPAAVMRGLPPVTLHVESFGMN